MRYFPAILCWVLPAALAAADFDWNDVPPCRPQFAKISYDDPDTDSRIAVSWQTRESCLGRLRFGSAPDALDSEVSAQSRKLSDNLRYIHEVRLSGLKPATTYFYTVGTDPEWSEVFSFRTAPLATTCLPFAFSIASDSRADSKGDGATQKWANIMNEALSDPEIAFLINGGDLVYDGANDAEWLKYLAVTPAIMAEKPVLPVIGNHDDGPGEGDTAHFNNLFQLPRNPVTGTEDSYYFRYGNALIIGISTATFTGLFAETADWMDAVLTENADALWKFVVVHHPFFCSAGIGINEKVGHEPNEKGQNPFFLPVIEKHQVDVVLMAHNHYYERFKPILGAKDAVYAITAPDYGQGTLYVLSGGGGATTIPDFLTNIMCGIGKVDGSEICSGLMHYVKIRIHRGTLSMETWATAQQVLSFNQNNTKLLDQVTITKAALPCSDELPDEEKEEKEEEDERDDEGEREDSVVTVDETIMPEDDTTAAVDDAAPEVEADIPAADADTVAPIITEDAGCGCSLVAQADNKTISDDTDIFPSCAGRFIA